MISYKKKYQSVLAENKAMKNDMKEVEINVTKMAAMYVSLSNQHSRLLVEYLNLQIQLEQVNNLKNRFVSNN